MCRHYDQIGQRAPANFWLTTTSWRPATWTGSTVLSPPSCRRGFAPSRSARPPGRSAGTGLRRHRLRRRRQGPHGRCRNGHDRDDRQTRPLRQRDAGRRLTKRRRRGRRCRPAGARETLRPPRSNLEQCGLELNLEAHPYEVIEFNDAGFDPVRGINEPEVNYLFCAQHASTSPTVRGPCGGWSSALVTSSSTSTSPTCSTTQVLLRSAVVLRTPTTLGQQVGCRGPEPPGVARLSYRQNDRTNY
jgi:hypothetical protein